MCIILLSGYAGSGKDTCGEYLCKQYGFKRYAVADIMKEEVSKVFEVPMDLLNSQNGKASTIRFPTTGINTTVRKVIIDYAMAKRAVDPDYWIDAMIRAIHESGDDDAKLVVTDFRFPNELSRLEQCFPNRHVVSVRIHRTQNASVNSTCSENVLDDFTFDHVIDNTGDLSALQSHVDCLLKKIQNS